MPQTQTRDFTQKVRGKGQHDAIKNARKRIPPGYTLKVRTAQRAQSPGVYYVQGLLVQRKRRP